MVRYITVTHLRLKYQTKLLDHVHVYIRRLHKELLLIDQTPVSVQLWGQGQESNPTIKTLSLCPSLPLSPFSLSLNSSPEHLSM